MKNKFIDFVGVVFFTCLLGAFSCALVWCMVWFITESIKMIGGLL